jgi:hypothetical protein
LNPEKKHKKKIENSSSHPINMTTIVNIFSELVFADMFPKPTLVKLLNVKYNAVM